MFWTAPEVLRCHFDFDELQLGKISPSDCQSPAADIYSLGVVWKETFCRNNPYSEHDELSPTGRVMNLVLLEVTIIIFNVFNRMPYLNWYFV